MNRKYKRFCALFETAETRIKQFEKLDLEPCIPAINQLRYAACHLKRSFQADDSVAEREAIKSAEHHCHRAIKDVTEASIDYVAMWVAEFEKGFQFVDLVDEIQEHNKYKLKIKEAVRFASECDHDRVEQSTDRLGQYMDELLRILDVYDVARPALNKRARKMRIKAIWAILGFILAIVAIVCH